MKRIVFGLSVLGALAIAVGVATSSVRANDLPNADASSPARIQTAALPDRVADDFDVNLGMTPDPAKGYELLMNAVMASPVFKEKDIERLWNVWEDDEKAKAEAASEDERRRMTFERYGWQTRPEGDSKLPFGYIPDGKGNMLTNCFVCHGGKVAGKTIPGAGNTHVDLTTLATDVQKLAAFDRGADYKNIPDVKAPFNTPLTQHRGNTNAVIFAPVFAALRTPALAKEYTAHPEKLLHHDINPPAWWNFKKKERIYCDAFAPKTPRQLMPFAMSPTFDDAKFHSFEPNFVHIKAYIESLEAPKYPYPIDAALAAKGKVLFEKSCSECHGTYGADGKFPSKVVDIEKLGTDPRRLQAIDIDRRNATNSGWLQYGGKYPVDLESKGYLAQPLDGIWASAPYLHNGSVPTLHALFNVDERPAIWKRDEDGYDQARVGLNVEKFDAIPAGINSRQYRMYYDTSIPGSNATGHLFPDERLDRNEKLAVMEYLKTL